MTWQLHLFLSLILLCVASGQGSNNFKRRCSSSRKQKAGRTAQGKTTSESITLAQANKKKLAKSKSDLIPFSSGLRSGRKPDIRTPEKKLITDI